MQIDLARSDFGSKISNVSRLKVSNMYVVENPLSASGVSYVQRPSISSYASTAGGLTRGIWSQNRDGITSIYVVSGTTLYKSGVGTNYLPVGDIPGIETCKFASTIYHIGIISGGNLYLSDGEIVIPVDIPDNQKVSDITNLDNYFIISIENSNKFYYIMPGDTTVDPLSFTSAERNPDDIISVAAVGDEMWAIGETSTEIFIDSGDANAPFVRLTGRVYDTGCADSRSVVRTIKDSLPCLVWVSSSKEVVLAQGVPSKISNESVEEVLRESTSFIGWSFRTARHDFYVLNTDTTTLVYDINANLWFRWFNYESTAWAAKMGIQINDITYVVSLTDNTISKLGTDTKDFGTTYIVCEVSGFIPNPAKQSTPCNAISLLVNFGYANSYDSNPIVELRWSDDAGANWSTYVQSNLGVGGNYDTDIIFRSLGLIKKPGRYVEFRFTDLQMFRLDGAMMNE